MQLCIPLFHISHLPFLIRLFLYIVYVTSRVCLQFKGGCTTPDTTRVASGDVLLDERTVGVISSRCVDDCQGMQGRVHIDQRELKSCVSPIEGHQLQVVASRDEQKVLKIQND